MKGKGNVCLPFILRTKANILTIFPHRKCFDLNYLLFTVYLILLSWLLLRIPFIKKAGINPKLVAGLFFFKIIAGIAIGWLSLHLYGPGNDYWDLNKEAWNEYQLLLSDPGKYFTNIFTSDYPGGYSGMFGSLDSFWNDLRENIIIKLVSIFNIFSRGDYYVNSLLFNFLVFFGHIALYRVFTKVYPGRPALVITGCFLLPSMIYFSSGIHKDGIVFLMLAILIYCVYHSLQGKYFTKNRLLLISTSLILLFLVRHFMFIALVPALVAWLISARSKRSASLNFIVVYLVAGVLFFAISSLTNKIDPPGIIVERQTQYLKLPVSETQIKLTPLEPNFKSFAMNAPQALDHLLLRPYLWELPVRSLLPLNIELVIYQLLFLLFLFFRRKEANAANTPFIYFAILFTLTLYLLIGYIVPNLGSIVRYRSIYLPLIITPLLCSIDWKKLKVKK